MTRPLPTRTARPSSLFLLLASLLALTSGCWRTSSNAPVRYQFKGTVTYNGVSVPTGRIRFLPDSSKGNRGPGAIATITNGEYETEKWMGLIAGPMIAEISGSDGIPVQVSGETIPSGTPLFESYRVEFEVDKNRREQNFDVPKDAGK